jgi:fatty acid synthase subunit alpha, fungi type
VDTMDTLQNETLGYLQLEFTSAPKKGQRLSLKELGLALSIGHSGALGKYTECIRGHLTGRVAPRVMLA